MSQSELETAFERAALDACSFLKEIGFEIVQQYSTCIRFARGDVEVEIYCGRHSHEVGVALIVNGERFSLFELIHLDNATLAKAFRVPVATTAEELATAVERVALLLKQFGALALRGDPDVVTALITQRRHLAESLALDVLVQQTKPLAEQAFRSGDYSRAAELYMRIRSRLSLAEIGKLELSLKRSTTRP